MSSVSSSSSVRSFSKLRVTISGMFLSLRMKLMQVLRAIRYIQVDTLHSCLNLGYAFHKFNTTS